MKGFVEWLAARRYRMILLAAALVLVPGIGIVGQAVVAFAVLRRGMREGALIALGATVLIVVALSAAGGEPATRAAIVVFSWVPVFALAGLLRATRSLSLTVQSATIAVLSLVAFVFVFGDPVSSARELLTAYATEVVGQLSDDAVRALSLVLTGTVGAVTLLVSLGALFIGRAWQAAMHRPGGFGLEFRELRLGTVLLAIASVVFVAAGLSGLTVLQNLTLVLLSAYLLQGLAVVHAFVAATASGLGTLWLAATYVALVVLMQFAVPALAGLGFLDSWFNFRSRLGGR